jgi:hypothetical protein
MTGQFSYGQRRTRLQHFVFRRRSRWRRRQAQPRGSTHHIPDVSVGDSFKLSDRPQARVSDFLIRAVPGPCVGLYSLRQQRGSQAVRPFCTAGDGLSLSLLIPRLRPDGRIGMRHGAGVWFKEPVHEMTIFAEQYDFVISLLVLESDGGSWHAEESEPDTFDRMSRR